MPALVPSAKSVCSTPPSSANNSPSPRGISEDVGEDPPPFNLPAPVKYVYGGHSLPLGVRFPSPAAHPWGVTYTPDDSALAEKRIAQAKAEQQLVYHRKGRAGKPSQTTPAPLYYRERAAIIHSSPALAPSSPSARRATPPTFWSPQLTATKSIPDLDLEDKPLPPTPVKATNCGRPGCVGVPARPHLSDAQHAVDAKNRRKSWTSAPAGALRPLTSANESGDVLMSPRIRALRLGEAGGLGGFEPLDDLELGREAGEEQEDNDRHSAFACYLFSQLADKAAPQEDEMEEMLRGRSAVPAKPLEEKRSLSVDAAALARRNSSSGPALGRPTRFLFSRGSPAASTTPLVEDETVSSFDPDVTIRGPTAASSRPQLTAGHFISATTASGISGISPFPSPPPSPPTAGRGRSTTRPAAAVVEGFAAVGGETLDARGRSHMRSGTAERSLSRPRESRSRGRQSSRAAEDREERDSRSRRRESNGRESRGRESRGRGRREEVDMPEDVMEEDERGRGRSRSLLRRGAGREIIFSGAGYGHG